MLRAKIGHDKTMIQSMISNFQDSFGIFWDVCADCMKTAFDFHSPLKVVGRIPPLRLRVEKWYSLTFTERHYFLDAF